MTQEIILPRLLGEGCVLQRGRAARIWGWYKQNTSVKIEFQGRETAARTQEDGYFEAMIGCEKAGGPFPLVLRSEDGKKKEVKEVYAGDVFVCSGQSNMELPVSRVREMFPEETGSRLVRQYKVQECPVFTGPLKDHEEAAWSECTGNALEEATALGYFFGKMIAEKEQVPVGIINISKGGTPAEAWMSEKSLAEYPDFLAVKRRFEDKEYIKQLLEEQEVRENAWHEALCELEKHTQSAEWKTLEVPGWFREQGLPEFSGLLHIKRTFEVPEELAGRSAVLKLGTLVDSDRTSINGTQVGETGYCYPPRLYPVPEGLLKAGENEIQIRLECRDGKGRITPDKPCDICFVSGEKISLRGTWQYQVRAVEEQAPVLTFITRQPTGMYQGMVAPCLNMTVKGVLWYQGESNEWYPESYEALLKGLIKDWRENWKQDRLPFIIIQLPACAVDIRGGGAWAVIREAQKKAEELPDVAVTVNLDLGEWNDLHPLNKKGVAQRAYLAARHLMYEENLIWQGPAPVKIQRRKGVPELIFDTKDGGPLLITEGQEPEEFEVAWAEGIYYPAEAKTEGNTVRIVATEGGELKTEEIQSVRYAWSDAPQKGLLKNSRGLLTSPFLINIKDEGNRLFNDGWEFSRQPLGTTLEDVQLKTCEFDPVGIPHDWLISQVKNLYEDGMGWYRKKFRVKETQQGEHIILRFDGIYMDSCIYVNGQQAGEWKYGYTTFEVDITEYLQAGENEIYVSVTHQAPNSRWYTGAGIYRNVWLKTVPARHIVSDGVYFSAVQEEGNVWTIHIDTEVAVPGEDKADIENLHVKYFLKRKTEEEYHTLSGTTTIREENEIYLHEFETKISEPAVWDVEHPDCYELKAVLTDGETDLQTERQTVGFRTLTFSPDQGFLLNHRKVKLNGVCDHHDLGCLGSAFHKKAMRRKLELLKEMGTNAVRLSHNMPAPEVMELADEMGLLIVSEAFDMWEMPKNPYDYARFFPEWYARDVKNWIRRDRNHPSVIMWSIGNEIYDTHAGERGQYWTRTLMDEVRKYDPRRNAEVTVGSNYMPWENAQKCADIIKNAGYNYGEKYYDEHHKAHPDWVIYGSETASVVQSRGIYHFPYRQSVLTDEDEQCSALGNSTTSWGAKSAEACILAEREHPYSCGQFIWTGFDYIGEPTPYHTKNSYFGQIDTAGFKKDSFYIYQAGWTDYRKNPMVHIFPYWDFNEGQLIDIRVCSNAPSVELFLNGRSQGTCGLDSQDNCSLTGHWQIPYEPGELRAVACDEEGNILAEERKHSFGDAAEICLIPSEESLAGDGEDLLFVEISVKDNQGYPVENANNRVHVQVSGAGRLVGTDNGDSTDTEEYISGNRRLFSGKLLAVCKAGTEPGEMAVKVSAAGLPDKAIIVPVHPAAVREGISEIAWCHESNDGQWSTDDEDSEIQVRNIRLTSSNGMHLHKDNPETTVTAQLCPETASDRQVFWNVVDDAGIPVKIASIEGSGTTVKVRANSDGNFRLRCMSKSGTDKIRIISSLEFMITGLGKAFTDPYEFVSAGLYDYSKGEIGNGNEHGVATARDGESQVGFRNLDFGAYGSDEITIPVFALTDDPYELQIYEGMPDEGGSLAGEFIYQKPKIWNVYQEATYRLNHRLRGVTQLCFVLKEKVHIKGFWFKKYNRAWQRLAAGECDRIYGDSFTRAGEEIHGIGNNVTIQFRDMDFGEKGTDKLILSGHTPLDKNTIILKFAREGKEEQRMIEFEGGAAEQTFSIEAVCGKCDVSFVFLPGCNFDFYNVTFCEKE